MTLGDETFPLPTPFLVLATQNPIEQEGTYTLPEAQTDRFMLKVRVDYPSLDEEKNIVRAHLDGAINHVPQPIVTLDQILRARKAVAEVYLDERITQYIADIVFATRQPQSYNLANIRPYIQYGASPRASISLALAARAIAFLHRRGYVIPEDVREVAPDVLRHRIGLTYEAEAAEVSTDEIITQILNSVEVP